MKKIITIMLTLTIILSVELPASAANLHVAHTSSLSWRASYDIKTKGNKIIKVSHIKTFSYIGKIVSRKIIRNSNSKVTLRMVKKVGTVNYIIKLIAKIKNKNYSSRLLNRIYCRFIIPRKIIIVYHKTIYKTNNYCNN